MLFTAVAVQRNAACKLCGVAFDFRIRPRRGELQAKLLFLSVAPSRWAKAKICIQGVRCLVFRAAGEQHRAGRPKRLCFDISDHLRQSSFAVPLSLVRRVDHEMPDIVGLFLTVVNNHDVSDHLVPGVNAEGHTLVPVHISLCQTADGG